MATACPECGHTPVGADSCPKCGANFRELPAWRRPRAITHGDMALTHDEEDDETRFDAQERGAVSHHPWSLAVATLALSGWWAARAAGVVAGPVADPRLFWIGVVAPLVVAAALITRRGAWAAAVLALPVTAGLAVFLAWPDWTRPATLLVALAHVTPLLGLYGDPGQARRNIALAVTLVLLVLGAALEFASPALSAA